MIPGPAKLGSYRLLRRIGVGGMAEVYEASVGDGAGPTKRLAVKLLLPHCRDDPELVKGFIDEANIASGLAHPNIVAIYDFGQIDDTYYLAMEYVDGWDLRALIERARRYGQPFPVGAAAYATHELALALHHIHTRDRDIVHRDVNPHNVFVTRDGHVKLGDFGVAKATARLARTEDGQIKGKLAYLAPEHVAGDAVTHRTDVYGAGLVLFELLTGRRFNRARRDVDLLANAMNPTLVLPSSVVPEAAPLDEIVGGALQRHPAMRTSDAGLLADQLARYLRQQPFDARAMSAHVLDLHQRDTIPEGILAPQTMPPLSSSSLERASSAGTVRLQPGIAGSDVKVPRRRGWIGAVVLAVLAVAVAALVGWWPRPTPTEVAAPSAAAPAVEMPDGAVAMAAIPDGSGAMDTTAVQRDGGRAPVASVDGSISPRDAAAVVVRFTRRARSTPRRRPRIKRRRSEELKRPTFVPPTPPVERRDSGPDIAAQRRRNARLRALAQQARQRGLWPGDQARYDELRAYTRSAIALGTGDAELTELERHVRGFAPDQTFIQRKLARLERAIGRPGVDEARRQRLTAASQRILRLVLGERLVEASGQISKLLGQLRR